jgi:MFS family permease
MCTTPWWGRLGDRVGHKPMLLRALLALAATQWWIAATDSVAVILAVRLLQGALAGYIAAAQAYGARLVTRAARGALMAQLQAATAIGSVAGPVLGGWLFDAWGFTAVNVWAGAACLLCAALAAIVLPPVAPVATRPAGTRAQKAPLRAGVHGLLLGIVLVQAGKMMPQAFFGLYAADVLHVSSRVAGLCYAGTALGLCVAAPFWARRFARMAHERVLAHVERILWACGAIVAVQALATDIVLFVLARVLWGVCLAALLPVFYGLLSREAADDEQGRVLGAGNGAAKAGALVGAGAGGLALAWVPLSAMFWTVALLYAVAAIGMRAIRITTFQTIQTTTGIS